MTCWSSGFNVGLIALLRVMELVEPTGAGFGSL
jgi:hypothetical protein